MYALPTGTFLPLPRLPVGESMPQLTFKNNRRSLEVGLNRFRREYGDAVVGQVLVPWARGVVKAVQRQSSKPKNRTGNMRGKFAFRTIEQQGKFSVQLFSRATSRQGFPYWIAQERGTRTGVPATRFVRRAVNGQRKALERLLIAETRKRLQRSGF